jgi:hypothetical protein
LQRAFIDEIGRDNPRSCKGNVMTIASRVATMQPPPPVQMTLTAAHTCKKGTENLFLLAQDVHYHVTALVVEVQALAQRMTLQPSQSRT